MDHTCGQPNGARAPSPASNPLLGSLPKAGGFPPLGAHGVSCLGYWPIWFPFLCFLTMLFLVYVCSLFNLRRHLFRHHLLDGCLILLLWLTLQFLVDPLHLALHQFQVLLSACVFALVLFYCGTPCMTWVSTFFSSCSKASEDSNKFFHGLPNWGLWSCCQENKTYRHWWWGVLIMLIMHWHGILCPEQTSIFCYLTWLIIKHFFSFI